MERTAIRITLAVFVCGACMMSCGTDKESPPTGLQAATDILDALEDYGMRFSVATRMIKAEAKSGSIEATELMDAMDAMELFRAHFESDRMTDFGEDVEYIGGMYDGIKEEDHHKLAPSLSPHVHRVQETWNELASLFEPALQKIEAIATAASGRVPSMASVVNARELAKAKNDELVRDIDEWQERVLLATRTLRERAESGRDLPGSTQQFGDAIDLVLDTLGEMIEEMERLTVVVSINGILQELAEADGNDEMELRRRNKRHLAHLSKTRTLRRQFKKLVRSVEPSLAAVEMQLGIGTDETNGSRD